MYREIHYLNQRKTAEEYRVLFSEENNIFAYMIWLFRYWGKTLHHRKPCKVGFVKVLLNRLSWCKKGPKFSGLKNNVFICLPGNSPRQAFQLSGQLCSAQSSETQQLCHQQLVSSGPHHSRGLNRGKRGNLSQARDKQIRQKFLTSLVLRHI